MSSIAALQGASPAALAQTNYSIEKHNIPNPLGFETTFLQVFYKADCVRLCFSEESAQPDSIRPPQFKQPASSSEVIPDSPRPVAQQQKPLATLSTASQFKEMLLPFAQKAAQQLGLDPLVLIAQAALETGWGKHIIADNAGNSSYNLFNIKAGDQDKSAVAVNTHEYIGNQRTAEYARFKAYHNLQASFDGYVALVQSQPRYQEAVAQANNPLNYLHALQQAGYATDPEYANKIYAIYTTL